MVILLSMSFGSAVRGGGFAANEPVNMVLDFTPPRIVTSGIPQRVEKVTPMLLLEVTGAQRIAWRSAYSDCADGISEVRCDSRNHEPLKAVTASATTAVPASQTL
jgi:hypothetical protein